MRETTGMNLAKRWVQFFTVDVWRPGWCVALSTFGDRV